MLDRLDDEWQQFFADFDYVIPVPLHAEKLKRRGFNQVDRIFSPWAKAHGLHYADILIRTKKTKSQYSLNPSERSINLHAAFALKKDISVANAKCLLLDDIFTTGSTLKNCAKVLKEHGARSVSGLVLASNADD